MGFSDIGENNQPKSFQETFEQKREEHRAELQRKEDEMRQSFVLRVKEKETELKEVEKDVGYTCFNITFHKEIKLKYQKKIIRIQFLSIMSCFSLSIVSCQFSLSVELETRHIIINEYY